MRKKYTGERVTRIKVGELLRRAGTVQFDYRKRQLISCEIMCIN